LAEVRHSVLAKGDNCPERWQLEIVTGTTRVFDGFTLLLPLTEKAVYPLRRCSTRTWQRRGSRLRFGGRWRLRPWL